jgi:hypothetical protein
MEEESTHISRKGNACQDSAECTTNLLPKNGASLKLIGFTGASSGKDMTLKM